MSKLENRLPKQFRLLACWYAFIDSLVIIWFFPRCWLLLAGISLRDFRVRFLWLGLSVFPIAVRGLVNYWKLFRLPTVEELRVEMIHFQALHRKLLSVTAKRSVSGGIAKIESPCVRAIQSDFIWHGFAHIFGNYYSYATCSRISFSPNVYSLSIEYLEFCHAHLGMATAFDILHKFESFAAWKLSGLSQPSLGLPNPLTQDWISSVTWRKKGQRVSEERKIATIAAQLKEFAVGREVDFQRAAMQAMGRTNLGRSLVSMAIDSTKLFEKIGLTAGHTSLNFLVNLMKLARLQ